MRRGVPTSLGDWDVGSVEKVPFAFVKGRATAGICGCKMEGRVGTEGLDVSKTAANSAPLLPPPIGHRAKEKHVPGDSSPIIRG